jgi:hypothetical protein
MKFLCVPCDSPMKLQSVGPPESGSLSVVYSCPECGYEMAMLTNPYETQLVQSLGVRIGPATDASSRLRAAGASASPGEALEGSEASTAGGKCPFTAMLPATESTEAQPPQISEPMSVRWTAAAEARLANIPAFVRPMAKTGIEKFARENGAVEVDEKILDAAREFFGM